MRPNDPVDTARLSLMLTDLRLPGISRLMIAVGPLRWWFSGMENHLCAGSPCNRSSDEIIHEVSTNAFC